MSANDLDEYYQRRKIPAPTFRVFDELPPPSADVYRPEEEIRMVEKGERTGRRPQLLTPAEQRVVREQVKAVRKGEKAKGLISNVNEKPEAMAQQYEPLDTPMRNEEPTISAVREKFGGIEVCIAKEGIREFRKLGEAKTYTQPQGRGKEPVTFNKRPVITEKTERVLLEKCHIFSANTVDCFKQTAEEEGDTCKVTEAIYKCSVIAGGTTPISPALVAGVAGLGNAGIKEVKKCALDLQNKGKLARSGQFMRDDAYVYRP